jgi:hypothetical protein
MARHDSSGQLNFAVIRQKLADATENAVMHASSGPDRRVHSNTDRRLRARLSLVAFTVCGGYLFTGAGGSTLAKARLAVTSRW